MPITKQDAQSILEPILEIVQRCIQESWNEWSGFYAPKHHVLDARARAAIVYCHIVDRAMELFRDVPGVTIGRKRGIFRLFVGDDVALRFKKAKKDGTTSNVSTHQQRLIDLQLTIPGILPGSMLNAVYQLDELQRDIQNMMVTHQLNGRVEWSIAVKSPLATPMEMPSPAMLPIPPSTRARLKGKGAKKGSESGG